MFQSSESHRGGWARNAVLAAVFVVASAAAVWLWWKPATQPAVDAGRAVVDEFLAQLRDGEADRAWDATTAEFKSAQGKESFRQKTKPLKFLREPLNFVSVQTVSIGEQPRTEYTYQSAKADTVRIVLGRDSGAWKVDHWTATEKK